MKITHPRLLAEKSTFTELSARRKTDAVLDRFLRNLENAGRSLLGEPPVRREMEGKRLLAVSREALERILLWSFSFRMTADGAFLRRAEEEMLAAARFADWNPEHFLDTAEMTAALAIGYDWLFSCGSFDELYGTDHEGTAVGGDPDALFDGAGVGAEVEIWRADGDGVVDVGHQETYLRAARHGDSVVGEAEEQGVMEAAERLAIGEIGANDDFQLAIRLGGGSGELAL